MSSALLVGKAIRARIHPANAPHLPLIFPLVRTQTKTASAALGLLPLSSLPAEPERDTLEVLLHAPLGARRQSASSAWAGHVFVEDLGFLVDDVEDAQESRFGRELDGDDHVAHGSEDGRHDGGEVRSNDVVMFAGDGADDDEREAARVG